MSFTNNEGINNSSESSIGSIQENDRSRVSSSLRPGSKAITGENNLLVIFLKV